MMNSNHWLFIRFTCSAILATVISAATASEITTTSTAASDRASNSAGMVYLPGGEFTMGTDDSSYWPVERPAHLIRVSPFWMDKYEVTNEQFAQFVRETGYVTTAETTPSLHEIMSQVPPGTPPPPPGTLVPGGLVFTPAPASSDLENVHQWWTWTPGASWRHPEGPNSSIEGRDKHPVVMVSWDDAQAYAHWAGKRLPTEAEWEYAARGGLQQKEFIWGDDFQPQGQFMANVWQGTFPVTNTIEDGFERTAPVGMFPPNAFGLYDMGGNVWEWCSDWFQPDLYITRSSAEATIDPTGPAIPPRGALKERVIRGGSFLCHPSYCSSYRPSARQGNAPDTGMSHVGFRLVKSAQP